MFVRCWVMYLFIHLIDKGSLQSQVEKKYGVVGGSVTLPCSYTDRVLKRDEINVFWRYNDSKVVFDIEKGNFSTKDQDMLFKDRTESVSSQFENGDFSITLRHLKLTDGGKFSCFIPKVKTEILNLQVNEAVPTPVPMSSSSPTSSSMKAHPAGIVTVFISVGLYLSVFIVVRSC